MTANCSILRADVDSCSCLMHISSTIIHDKINLYSLTDVVVDSYSWTPTGGRLKASPTSAKLCRQLLKARYTLPVFTGRRHGGVHGCPK